MIPPQPPPGFAGPFTTDVVARELYSETAGIQRIVPAAVALPRDVDDLRLLVAWATRHRVALVPRGSGSSMSGGAIGAGVIVDLHHLDRPPAVIAGWDRVETGVARTRAEVDDAARNAGLRFPVDPSSSAFATIGGMMACNAAGARTLAFGATRRWVRAIDCVFADGTAARVTRGDHVTPHDPPVLKRWFAARDALRARASRIPRREVRKDASGYGLADFAGSGDLVDLLVGSEGTLALFTGAQLDLAPLPAATGSLLGSWPSIDGAVRGAAIAREAGAVACELLDTSFLRVAARAHPLPVSSAAESVLLVELEGRERDDVKARARALEEAWSRSGAVDVLLGLDDESAESLWGLRHAASPILSRLDPHIRSMQIIEDGCVPPHRLADYVRGVRQLLVDARLEGVLFGHAGDAHLHVNALVDVRHPDWRSRVRALYDGAAGLTSSLGGTMAGEHGDGRLRSPLIGTFHSAEARELMADVKALFDPAGILNPGVKAGDAGDPLSSIKYDLDVPCHPQARALLDEVERARSYDTCRLELLAGSH